MIVTATWYGHSSYEDISVETLLRGTQLISGSIQINSHSVGNWPKGLEVSQVVDCLHEMAITQRSSRAGPQF